MARWMVGWLQAVRSFRLASTLFRDVVPKVVKE
jgi:hypothetical protein